MVGLRSQERVLIAGSVTRFLYIVAVNVALALVLLVLIEGCVRIMQPEIRPLGTDETLIADSVFDHVAGPRPGASGRSNGAQFTVSPSGYWEYSNATESADSAWLFLGDSVTMGVGVEPDHTFVGTLAAQTDAYTVLNPSLMGYGADEYATILDHLLNRREDIQRVTIVWCLNDIYVREANTRDPDQSLRRTLGPVLSFLHRNVYTYQWRKAALFDRPRRYFEYDAALYDSPLLEAVAEDLERIAGICREHALRCEIVLMPYEYQLRTNGQDDVFRPQNLLKSRLADVDIPVYNAASYLQTAGIRSSELYVYADGIHFSPKGHALLARFLGSVGNAYPVNGH